MIKHTPREASTEKAERKSAAAEINDPKVFQATKFGRRRTPRARLHRFVLFLGMPLTMLRQSVQRAR